MSVYCTVSAENILVASAALQTRKRKRRRRSAFAPRRRRKRSQQTKTSRPDAGNNSVCHKLRNQAVSRSCLINSSSTSRLIVLKQEILSWFRWWCPGMIFWRARFWDWIDFFWKVYIFSETHIFAIFHAGICLFISVTEILRQIAAWKSGKNSVDSCLMLFIIYVYFVLL